MGSNKKGKTGSLRDQLRSLQITPTPSSSPPTPADAPKLEPSPAGGYVLSPPPAPEAEPISDDELFARALDSMDPGDVFRGKFQGVVEGVPETPTHDEHTRHQAGVDADEARERKRADDEAARQAIARAREAGDFERAVGEVERLGERGKYHVPSPRPYSSEPNLEMSTPPMPKSGEGLRRIEGLSKAHKDLLARFRRRARRDELPELNLRGDSVDDALRQLELFVHQCWKRGEVFCRVIHGRGVSSEEGPALKPAVLHWLEGPGFRYIYGYAPELVAGGDYGSVIVEIQPR